MTKSRSRTRPAEAEAPLLRAGGRRSISHRAIQRRQPGHADQRRSGSGYAGEIGNAGNQAHPHDQDEGQPGCAETADGRILHDRKPAIAITARTERIAAISEPVLVQAAADDQGDGHGKCRGGCRRQAEGGRGEQHQRPGQGDQPRRRAAASASCG